MSENGRSPERWILVPLHEVVDQRSERADPAANAGLPFIGMDHVESGSRRIIGSVPSETMKSTAKKFEPGDVLYGRLRPYLNKVARPDFEGLASAEFIVLRSASSFSPAFLEYRLSARDFVSYASHQGEGDRPRVSYEQIASFEVGVPPRGEQERIVDAIDELFSQIDAGAASLESAQTKLERYRASVLKAAVEGKLTADWREANPDVEPADELLERILSERRKRWEEEQLSRYEAKGKKPPKGWREKYKEPEHPNQDGLPDLPESWRWVSLETLFHSVSDGDHAAPPQMPQGIPFLVIGNIRDGRLNFDDTRFVSRDYYDALEPSRTPEKGDILYSVTGSFGIPVVVETDQPFCVQRHIAILKPCESVSLSLYVHLLKSPLVFNQASKVATGTAQKTVGLKNLRKMALPLPPADEQTNLLDRIESMMTASAVVGAALHRGAVRGGNLRQSILKQAFRGTLVPQDPSDEPAFELLKRIKDEGEKGGNGGSGGKGRRKHKIADLNQDYSLIPKSPDE